MLGVILFSAILFFCVTALCRYHGLFDSGSMGIGRLFAFGLYLFGWVLPSLCLFVGLWVA